MVHTVYQAPLEAASLELWGGRKVLFNDAKMLGSPQSRLLHKVSTAHWGVKTPDLGIHEHMYGSIADGMPLLGYLLDGRLCFFSCITRVRLVRHTSLSMK